MNERCMTCAICHGSGLDPDNPMEDCLGCGGSGGRTLPPIVRHRTMQLHYPDPFDKYMTDPVMVLPIDFGDRTLVAPYAVNRTDLHDTLSGSTETVTFPMPQVKVLIDRDMTELEEDLKELILVANHYLHRTEKDDKLGFILAAAEPLQQIKEYLETYNNHLRKVHARNWLQWVKDVRPENSKKLETAPFYFDAVKFHDGGVILATSSDTELKTMAIGFEAHALDHSSVALEGTLDLLEELRGKCGKGGHPDG